MSLFFFFLQPYVPERHVAAISERWLLQGYSILEEESVSKDTVRQSPGTMGCRGWLLRDNNAFLLKLLLCHLWGPVFAFQRSCKDGKVENLEKCNLLSHHASPRHCLKEASPSWCPIQTQWGQGHLPSTCHEKVLHQAYLQVLV